jgi:hypothetical protein
LLFHSQNHVIDHIYRKLTLAFKLLLGPDSALFRSLINFDPNKVMKMEKDVLLNECINPNGMI